MNKKLQIEVEFRSILNKRGYNNVRIFLKKNAKDLGEDNKDTYFFILEDKLLKVVNNISRENAKIVLKLNKIGRGSDFEEIEILINQDDIEKSVKFFTLLGLNEIQHSFQKRHNYFYKGIEFALKYSDIWSYHLELEKMVHDRKDIFLAEKQIQKIAVELGIHLMTDKELAEFTRRKDYEYQQEY
ncbi:MAG: CYTH domain-containing protein [Promethearchaeota archaeon]